MAKVKPRFKFGIVPALLLAAVAIAIIWTTVSPSADVAGAPTVTGISPTSAKIGEVISIRGRGFQPGTSQVYMGNGVVTNYLANSSTTSLNVYVPDTVCQPPVTSSCRGITIKPGTSYKVYVKDLQGRKSREYTFTVKK